MKEKFKKFFASCLVNLEANHNAILANHIPSGLGKENRSSK